MGKKHFSFFGGLFLGSLFGGAMAFLFTPLTGKEAREKIKEKVDEIKISPPEALENIKENSQEAIASTISSIEEGITRISLAVDEAKKAADKKREELGENSI